MQPVLANCSASITDLKKNPSSLIEEAQGEPIVILNHNRPTAYLIPAKTYQELLAKLEDYELGLIVKARQKDNEFAIGKKLENELQNGNEWQNFRGKFKGKLSTVKEFNQNKKIEKSLEL